MRALVIIPTYQEAENITVVLDQVRANAPSADVLVVDDGSPDGTAELAEAFAADQVAADRRDGAAGGDSEGAVSAEGGRVTVLRRPVKEGLGPAYRAGFAHGLARGYDVLVEMDADLSHDPASLPDLLTGAEQGADLVIGSRYVAGGSVPGWPRHRLWLSRVANRYAAFALGINVADATAGYRAYRASMLGQIDLDAVRTYGYGFQVELLYAVLRRGGRVVEVPICFRDRVRGTSKMSLRIVGEAIRLVTWWGIRDRVLRRRRGSGSAVADPEI